ncbi:MAG: helix-turn-helix transcriptional regulator [Verrucomicrobiota bacterium]
MQKRKLSIVFGKLLKEKRLKIGLSQELLAEKAEVHPTYIGLLERGKRSPSINVAARVAHALGTRLSKMVSEAEQST